VLGTSFSSMVRVYEGVKGFWFQMRSSVVVGAAGVESVM
jgi:hypothetical protein